MVELSSAGCQKRKSPGNGSRRRGFVRIARWQRAMLRAYGRQAAGRKRTSTVVAVFAAGPPASIAVVAPGTPAMPHCHATLLSFVMYGWIASTLVLIAALTSLPP